MAVHTPPIILLYNTFLYEGHNPNNCCILGFHGATTSLQGNGRQAVHTYMFASYSDPGIFGTKPGDTESFVQDIHGLSHEVQELYDDPFGNNVGISPSHWVQRFHGAHSGNTTNSSPGGILKRCRFENLDISRSRPIVLDEEDVTRPQNCRGTTRRGRTHSAQLCSGSVMGCDCFVRTLRALLPEVFLADRWAVCLLETDVFRSAVACINPLPSKK